MLVRGVGPPVELDLLKKFLMPLVSLFPPPDAATVLASGRVVEEVSLIAASEPLPFELLAILLVVKTYASPFS